MEAIASSFYAKWRADNQRQGMSDHGHRREIKDCAARWMIEFFVSKGAPIEDPERLVDLAMERPADRAGRFRLNADGRGDPAKIPPKPLAIFRGVLALQLTPTWADWNALQL
jgi:hypothetical protein